MCGMKRLLYMAGWVLLGTCTAVGQTEPAVSVQADSVDLQTMNRDSRCGQVLVTCLINGKPMRMMLDTGATHTVLHKESAAALPNAQWLDTSKMTFRGNSAQRPEILLAELQVGDKHAPQHPIMVVSLASIRGMMPEPVDGILGMDVLGAMPFTFDLRSGKCYWGVPAGELLLPLYGTRDDNGRLMVRVSCAGKSMELLLDTGSSITRVYAGDWKKGKGKKVNARLGDVDTTTSRKVTTGAAAQLELVPGVNSATVTPIICSNSERSMLGMDALQGVVLVHVPGQSGGFGSFFVTH